LSQSENIRNGIVTNLQPLLNAGTVGQILPYAQSNLSPPVIYVTRGETTFDLAMSRGGDLITYLVVALISHTQDIEAQELLDQLLDGTGSSSVKTLIESDRTLGGACQASTVDKVSRPQLYETASLPPALGCEWTVEVYT
jgi:hypothetical protein